MPIARIDLLKGKGNAYRKEGGRVVHEATLSVRIQNGDRFQVVSEHDPEECPFDSGYLGIHRSEYLVIVQITSNEGRTSQQKKTLFGAIADDVHAAVGLLHEDVLINLIEVKKETWSFGNGIAQYAL
jgi:phenylpyruvate tautomerase PptA (4-oxalocrotonate tautomerase family)